jgi:hypothetical protein
MKTKKKPPVAGQHVESKSPAVSPSGRCAICKGPNANTSVEVSPFGIPFTVRACAKCTRPVWHALGLVSWGREVGLAEWLRRLL